MNTIIRDAAIACAFAFTFGATRAGAQAPSSSRLDSTQVAASWGEDLAYMAPGNEPAGQEPLSTVSPPGTQDRIRTLPVKLYSFKDGWFVGSATVAGIGSAERERPSHVGEARALNIVLSNPPTRLGAPAPERCGGATAPPPWLE